MMSNVAEILKAIQFPNLDAARRALTSLDPPADETVFDDGGEEPQGLLSVVTEDLVGEEAFYRLFDGESGTLVEVEQISYSGFGPPAQEADYMGFVTREVAYVLAGRRLPIEIVGCPCGARDIHHLEAQVLDGEHPLERGALQHSLELPEDWNFEDLVDRIAEGQLTAQQIDDLLH